MPLYRLEKSFAEMLATEWEGHKSNQEALRTPIRESEIGTPMGRLKAVTVGGTYPCVEIYLDSRIVAAVEYDPYSGSGAVRVHAYTDLGDKPTFSEPIKV